MSIAATPRPQSITSLTNRFWNSYAKVYGSVENLVPHRLMLDEVAMQVPQSARRVLDAGCGSGALLSKLANYRPNLELFGTDFSGDMLERARERNPSAQLIPADLNNPLPFEDGYFDCVVSTNALYAVASPADAIHEFNRVLQPQGKMVISTPKQRAVGLKILASHVRSVSVARGIGDLVKFGTCLVPNLIIEKMARKKAYHFLSREEVLSLPGEVEILKDTFANQNWLFTLLKQKKGAAVKTIAPSVNT